MNELAFGVLSGLVAGPETQKRHRGYSYECSYIGGLGACFEYFSGQVEAIPAGVCTVSWLVAGESRKLEFIEPNTTAATQHKAQISSDDPFINPYVVGAGVYGRGKHCPVSPTLFSVGSGVKTMTDYFYFYL